MCVAVNLADSVIAKESTVQVKKREAVNKHVDRGNYLLIVHRQHYSEDFSIPFPVLTYFSDLTTRISNEDKPGCFHDY